MNVYGYEIPQHVIEGAFCFMRREPFTSAMLEGVISRLIPSDTKGTRHESHGMIAMRAADRLVQTEKRAGRLVADYKFMGKQFWAMREQA